MHSLVRAIGVHLAQLAGNMGHGLPVDVVGKALQRKQVALAPQGVALQQRACRKAAQHQPGAGGFHGYKQKPRHNAKRREV